MTEKPTHDLLSDLDASGEHYDVLAAQRGDIPNPVSREPQPISRVRGYMFAQWTINCGCSQWIALQHPKRGKAAQEAKRHGWRLSRKHGWLCEDCSAKPEFK